MFLKSKVKIFFVAITLGMLSPVFSLYASNQNSGFQYFEVKLDRNANVVFGDDINILQASPIFIAPEDAQFKNVYEIKTQYSLSDFQKKYSNDIIYADSEKTLKVGDISVQSVTPVSANDPGFTSNAGDINRAWGLPKAGFTDAWNKTTGSSAVSVAIIDTGIDGQHEDLSAGQVGAGFDFLQRLNIAASSNSDDNGHGTLVAGVIGATPNNFRGIVGTDWNVNLMPLKALDASGSGNSADVASAIVYAADHGANVINMSLGGVGFGNDTTLSNAITYAFNKNIVIVAAAGNDVAADGGNLDANPVFPVCDDNGKNMVIGVAAVDYNDQKADFSNFGKACVDVSAPGKRILSSIDIDPTTKTETDNSYAYASGTSLAAPFVSGEAALIKAMYPQASNKEIRDRIIKSADPIDANNLAQCAGTSCAGMIGSGRINAYRALDPNLLPESLQDGELVQGEGSAQVYLIVSGQKDPISPFVMNQRYKNSNVQVVPQNLLDAAPTGPYALPNDNTLVKSLGNPTVFEIVGGLKEPVTYQVFLQRNYSWSQVNIISDPELNSWLMGTFLPPVEGTLVKSPHNPTVYWTINGLLHPMNAGFYNERGLNIFPIMIVSDNDLKSFAKGNAFVR